MHNSFESLLVSFACSASVVSIFISPITTSSAISMVLVFLFFLSISYQYLLMGFQFFCWAFGWDGFSLGFPPFLLTSLLPCQLPSIFQYGQLFSQDVNVRSK